MSVQPGQIVRGGAWKSRPEHLLVRVQHRKLIDEPFRLPARVRGGEKRRTSGERPRNRGDEFHYDLMGNSERAIVKTRSQNLDRALLFPGIARIVSIDGDVRVNEGGTIVQILPLPAAAAGFLGVLPAGLAASLAACRFVEEPEFLLTGKARRNGGRLDADRIAGRDPTNLITGSNPVLLRQNSGNRHPELAHDP
jgi:hypothetical protein